MSEEREFAHAEWRQSFFDRTSREPTPSEAWYAALKWQAGRQSAGANETTLRVLSSHAIRKHEGVTIFGDPAQVLKVMAAIESAGATGQEPVGVIERDEINGWHMNALIDWEKIGLGTKLYAAPIDDNGAKAHEFMATRTASGPELHAALAASQPVESKRVELTDDALDELFDLALRSTCSRDRFKARAIELLARASAKGE